MRQLRVYKLVDKIMSLSDGKVSYQDALNASTLYYKDKPLFYGLMVHVDTNFVAHEYARKLRKA